MSYVTFMDKHVLEMMTTNASCMERAKRQKRKEEILPVVKVMVYGSACSCRVNDSGASYTNASAGSSSPARDGGFLSNPTCQGQAHTFR